MEDVEESRRAAQEKQAKAEQHRSRLQEERTQKYKMASDKVVHIKCTCPCVINAYTICTT